MENIDNTQIESYLRGKMTPEERAQFESALAANPELQQRTEELRQFAGDIRQVARSDIRRRVEAVRDQVKQEETGREQPPQKPLFGWIKPLLLLTIGMLLGLVLGWLLFQKEPSQPVLPITRPIPVDTVGMPVAIPQYEEIANVPVLVPGTGKTIQMNIRYLPGLEKKGGTTPARIYALDPGGTGLCIYARRDDYFWRNPLELLQTGSQFYLKIGDEKFPLKDDGDENPFPEKPAGN